MRFEEVLPLLKEGKKIRRSCWVNVDAHWKLNEDNNDIVNQRGDHINKLNGVYIGAGVFSHVLKDDWVVAEPVTLAQKAYTAYRTYLGGAPNWVSLSPENKAAWDAVVTELLKHAE